MTKMVEENSVIRISRHLRKAQLKFPTHFHCGGEYRFRFEGIGSMYEMNLNSTSASGF
jgi:hypothetical protein